MSFVQLYAGPTLKVPIAFDATATLSPGSKTEERIEAQGRWCPRRGESVRTIESVLASAGKQLDGTFVRVRATLVVLGLTLTSEISMRLKGL